MKKTRYTIISFILLFFLAGAAVSCSGNDDNIAGNEPVTNAVKAKPNKIIYWNCKREFNDMNDTHLKAARKIGINPLSSKEQIPEASKKLYMIGGPLRFGEPYVVDKLTHSSPFLVKEAVELLHDIGQAFQDSLRNKHMPPYSVLVSSVLRTDADIKNLSKRNINASQRSVHCYGTTVDISYKRFVKHDDEGKDANQAKLKAVLAEVLRDLKKQGRCYVKHEVKQACFHITVRE
jgi:hypothetical protein